MHKQARLLHPSSAAPASIPARLLCRLGQAFAEGLALCSVTPPPVHTPPWQKELGESLSAEQQKIVKSCIFYLHKARNLAAQGDISASIQLFAVARTFRDDDRLGDEARQLCISTLEAAEAYLDYVSGDFDIARQRILAAMFADELLEQTYGYAHLHIHRIHLANNLVKLEACAGRLDAALSLAADVLQYVAGEVGTIDAPTRWGSAWTSALCEDAQRYLAIQTTREIGCALAGLSDAGTLALWQQSIAPLQQAPCHPSRAGNLAEWYQLKGLYLASAFQTRATVPTYLEHAALYLAQGPRGDALCWQLVALDVLLACENSEHPDSCLLRQQIIDALDRAPVLPRHLRNLLRRVQPRKPAAEQGVSDRRAYAASRTGSHGD